MSDLFANLFTNPLLATLMLILGFGFLIFVHELGHFLVAKWVGIRATQFAVGFGQAIVAYRKGVGLRLGSTETEYRKRTEAKLSQQGVMPNEVTEKKFFETADSLGLGETEYRLNWLPLGGYVKMLGQEDMDPNAQSDDPRAFNRKSIGARAAVISAGVIVNLVVGMIFLIIAFSDFAGVNFPAPKVGDTVPGSPAATTYAVGHEDDPAFRGLQPGDEILTVNGKPIEDFAAVNIAAALGREGTPVELTVQRRGHDAPLTYRITAVEDPRQERLLSLGVLPASTLTINPDITPGSWTNTSWSKLGLQPGMTAVAVDGQAVEIPADFDDALRAAGNRDVAVTFADGTNNAPTQLTLTPRALLPYDDEGAASLLGFSPAAVVREVSPDMPAAQIGLQAGDVLARVGSIRWPASVMDVIEELENSGDAPVAISVLRDGQKIQLGEATPRGGKLGVGIDTGLTTNVVRETLADTPAASLNLPPGSRITALNGEPITDFGALTDQLQKLATTHRASDNANAPLSVELQTFVNVGDGTAETATLTLDAEALAQLDQIGWGLPRLSIYFEPDEIRLAGENIGEAAAIGVDKTIEFVQQTYITLLRLIQGSIRFENLRGPVGIVDAGVTVASRGWAYFLFFIGIISINLAVINFLPLPIVDGGLMVFLIIEKLRGKPAGPAIQSVAMIVGLVLIAGVFLIVTYHDIARIVNNFG